MQVQVLDDIRQVLEKLPEDRQREVLDFARFIAHTREEEEWRATAKEQFAKAYGADEPGYSLADIKKGTRR